MGLAPDQPVYRILIADDQESNRRLIAKILTPLKFDLREVENGRQAIDIWREWRPDLILMDIRMPVMDGREAAREIKDRANEGKTVIIAVTASTFEQEKDDIMAAGCDDFLRKPFLAGDLLGLLARHLGVKYIYEAKQAAEDREPYRPEKEVGPDDLSDLPGTWLQEMRAAAVRVDYDAALNLARDLKEKDPSLAGFFENLVVNYRFDRILLLVEKNNAERES